MIGFVADYPASAGVVDAKGHTSSAPCTHCSFRRKKQASSKFAFSSKYHCFNSARVKGMLRSMALRFNNISDDDCTWLGMSSGTLESVNEAGKWPLLKLSKEIHRARKRIKLNNNKDPVVSCAFDSIHSNIVAPDHLFTGIVKCLLTCCLNILPTIEERGRLQFLICSSLRIVGMKGQASIFNLKTRKLNSLSMSTLYCIITVLPFIIKNSSLSTPLNPCIKMIDILHKLVAFSFYWPTPKVDGAKQARFVHDNTSNEYHATVRNIALTFIKEVDIFCAEHNSLAKLIDKPNIHRL